MSKDDRLDKVLRFVDGLQKEIVDYSGENKCIPINPTVFCPAWNVCKDSTKPCSYWLKKYIKDGE